MKRVPMWTTSLILILVLSGCSVISRDLRTKADPLLTFELVSPYPTQYAGEIVIWGGYIIEHQTQEDQARLVILQAPLSFNQEPKSKDRSQGRFMVLFDAYLDPEVFAKDRAVTIAGRVAEFTKDPDNDAYGSYPVLHLLELHLWENRVRLPYYHRPYPFYRYRYHHPYHHGSSFHLLFGF